MSERKLTEFEKLCRQNRQRDDVKRVNEHIRGEDEQSAEADKEIVQNLNNYVSIMTGDAT